MSTRLDLSKVITIIVLLIASIGILYAVFTFNNDKVETAILEIGKPAPDFTLESAIDGKPINLSDYKGKVVLVNFWASWCEPCRLEMPDLEAAYETYKDQGLVVLGVNLAENDVTVKGYAANNDLTFPIVLDKDREVGVGTYKVRPIPTTFFVDRAGNLRKMTESPMTYQFIEETVKPLLAE